MDYVVAGFGIGAILALAGFALWELFGATEEPGRGWLTRASIGLMIGSLVIWSVTAVSLLSIVDDSTGSHLVLLTSLVTLIAIAACTFWYWRADQALLATLPPQQRVSRQTEVTAATVASPANTPGDVDLSDWDNWPERETVTADSTDKAAQDEVSFEPEVAAVVEVGAAEELADDGALVVETPDEAPIDVLVDGEAPGEDVQPDDVEIAAIESNESSDQPIDTSESEPSGAVEQSGEPEDVPAAQAELPLPANVRPLRPRPVVAPAPAALQAQPEELPIPTAEQEPSADIVVEQPAAQVVAIEIEDIAETVVPDDVMLAPEVAGPPAAFESSLLADIDLTAAQKDGRYQSPLLADLEPNPDELEGVGLAKWRPDARLTDDDTVEAPPKKSGRRR